MKLIKQTKDQRVFQITRREKRLLFEILKLYPLIPIAHHRLSRTADAKAIEADQRLLEEALAERRKENRKQLMAMLTDENRFARARWTTEERLRASLDRLAALVESE